MTNMYTKQDDKLVEVIKQPDIVVEQTLAELKTQLESSIGRRDIKVMELAGLDQEIAGLQAKIAKCAELGIKEVEVLEPVTPDAGNA